MRGCLRKKYNKWGGPREELKYVREGGPRNNYFKKKCDEGGPRENMQGGPGGGGSKKKNLWGSQQKFPLCHPPS